MYFWRTRALAEELRAGRVAERQRMWCLLSQTVLVSGSIPVSFEAWPSPLSTGVTWVAMAAINAAGVLLCYEANRQGDDRDFVTRFVWPVTIRPLALFVLPVLITVWWASRRASDGPLGTELVALSFGFVFLILYYGRLRSHLRWIAATPSP